MEATFESEVHVPVFMNLAAPPTDHAPQAADVG